MQSVSTPKDPSSANVSRATEEVDLIVLVSTTGCQEYYCIVFLQ